MESPTPVNHVNTESRKSHEKIVRIYRALQHEDENIIINFLQTEGDINYKTPQASVGVGDLLHAASGRRMASRLLELLLDYGADFTRKDNEGKTSLLKIIKEDAVVELLTHRKFRDERVDVILAAHLKFNNPSNPCDANGISHFHAACMTNNPVAVEFFLKSGVDVNQAVNANSPIFPGDTALHLAVKNTCPSVVGILLYYGANTLLKNAEGYSSLHLIIEDYMQELLSKDMSQLGDEFRIFSSFAMRDLNHDNIIDCFDFSKLHVACLLQDHYALSNVLEQVSDINRPVNIDSPVCPGFTALHFAAFANVQVFKLLLNKGANIDVKNARGETPFDLCLQNYTVKDVQSILLSKKDWGSIVLSDNQTKLIDVIAAMESLDEFKSFLNCTKSALAILVPWNSPLWPGYTLLHLAVVFSKKLFNPEVYYLQQKDDTDIVAECLERGADMTATDAKGSTALHVAFYMEKLCMAQYLLDHHNQAINPVDIDNLSHFHIACAAGHLKAVDHFLSNYVNVNLPILSTFKKWDLYICPGSTALHINIASGEVEITEKLLQHGADFNTQDVNGFTPIHRLLFSRHFRNKKRDSASLLSVENFKNCTTYSGLSHLHVACFFKAHKTIEKLLRLGADINAFLTDKFDVSAKDYYNFFFDSHSYSHKLMSLMSQFAGYTPLHFAYKEDENCETTFMLIERGADIFAKNAEDVCLLQDLLQNSKFDKNRFCRAILKDSMQTTQTRLEEELGITKLHLACFADDFVLMENYINSGANVNATVKSDSPIWQGRTPLYLVVERAINNHIDKSLDENFKKIIRLLIARGADPLLADDNGNTAFHLIDLDVTSPSSIAILFENMEIFSSDPTNNEGLSLFHIACITGNAVIIEKFLRQGVDVNQTVGCNSHRHFGSTPLHLLLEYLPLLRVPSSSWCGCSDEKFLQLLDMLLVQGADVNATDTLTGETPIFKLVKFHRVTELREYATKLIGLRQILIEKLISKGADVHATNMRGNTAFELLLRQGNVSWEEIELFLKAGCHLNAYNPISWEGYLGEALIFHRSNELQTNNIMDNQFLQRMINYAKMTEIDDAGRTAIHNVVSVNDFETERDEARRPYTDHESTAFRKVYAELIEQLSIHGCDIDHADFTGKTALHLAVIFDNNGAILGLLKNGADIDITDKEGKTAFAHCYKFKIPTKHRWEHETVRDKIERLREDTAKIFAMHIYKLESCGHFVNQQNKQLKMEVMTAHPFANSVLNRFHGEIEKAKSMKIGTTWLLLHAFLTNPDADIVYMNMTKEERREIDQFFKNIGQHNFLEIDSLLKLKYRQTIERIKLVELALESLNCLIEDQLSNPCYRHILKFLKNKDLQRLIASTA